jgi:beta-galactosidase GanA
MTLMNWKMYGLPMNDSAIMALQPPGEGLSREGMSPGAGHPSRPGIFFRGSFNLDTVADTYIDMSNFQKGMIWVNGHNLGRYWRVGPQQHLYCPAPWLKKGRNEVIVFDLHRLEAATLRGVREL